MLTISTVLGELIEQYFVAAQQGKMECRLIVPGQTQLIAHEIHGYLRDRHLTSYLVVGENLEPNEEKCWLRPNGLTSKRIGSFIMVVSPGQLTHIQDSVRGSGGAIRSLAFSEEWPWIDNGCEAFCFHGPVLNRLVSKWSHDKNEKDWLKGFIRFGLVKTTMQHSARAELLLEKMLGTFDASAYAEIRDIRKKLLFHVGVPSDSGNVPAVTEITKSTTELCQAIVDRCRKEDDLREQVHSMMPEIASDEKDSEELREAVDVLLDGIGSSLATNLGHLAFHSCWGEGKAALKHWQKLSVSRLREIFRIRTAEPPSLIYDLECSRGIISGDQKFVGTFVGEPLLINVFYRNIPEPSLEQNPWQIVIWNRTKNLQQESISSTEGKTSLLLDTSDIGSYERRIQLRIVLMEAAEIRCAARFVVQLCGEDRPSFVVVEPGFETIDATERGTDGTADKKIDVIDPAHIFVFEYGGQEVSVENDDGNQVEIVPTGHEGIWKTAQRVDPAAAPSTQVRYIVKIGERSAVISFEATDIEKGEFTLEDELRVSIVRKNRDRVDFISGIFSGSRINPYLHLGKITSATRRRMMLATIMTSRLGWRPLLADLLSADFSKSSTKGDYLHVFGNVDEDTLNNLQLPEDVLPLLNAYIEARAAIQKTVSKSLDLGSVRIEHPVYASHPIYVAKSAGEMEELLIRYLVKYRDLLAYLDCNRAKLEWSQIFVLTYLDCAVHWERGSKKNTFFLVGPWHPLVLCKRYMVQSILSERAQKFLAKNEKKYVWQLTALLEGLQGFRWITSISSDDRLLEPAYVSSTNDPGWHFAIKTGVVAGDNSNRIVRLRERLSANLGLEANISFQGTADFAESCLTSYLHAFPSRRAIGIRVCRGYLNRSIFDAVDEFLHGKEEPTMEGQQVPGGVRLFLEESLDPEIEYKQLVPPIEVYQYKNDDGCFSKENPDIYLIPPEQLLSFRTSQERYDLPRGQGLETVLYEPLTWLTEGQSQIPKSITYEYDKDNDENVTPPGQEGLGRAFVSSLKTIGRLFENPTSLVQSIELPMHLRSPWAISPGGSLDPAVFVKYVRDGAARSLEERALWDYKIDISKQRNSFYILSTIPRSFSVAVNGIFEKDGLANSFIEELGKIGIAVGGEALKSGRHALGIVGLVGAVRMLMGIGGGGLGPLINDKKHASFIVPVDSFSSFFGYEGAERTDLLAVQLALPDNAERKLRIFSCGVESKFVSGAYSNMLAIDALGQAKATSILFNSLIGSSLDRGGIPERLGLLSILKFGLRISSPSSRQAVTEWIETERQIEKAILDGRYEFSETKYDSVLVTTEMGFPGAAVAADLSGGLWIRLNRNSWPGVAESPSLAAARDRLAVLFGRETPKEDIKKSVRPETEDSTNTPLSVTPAEPQVTKGEAGPGISVPDDTVRSTQKKKEESRRLDRIFLGVDDGRRSVYFDPHLPIDPLDNLNMMITGSAGTGKTQFIKYLVCMLRDQNKNLLLLDFKNDFAGDSCFIERARLSTAYVNTEGLPFNPLIPYPVENPRTKELIIQLPLHIAGISAVLKKTYNLGAQQQIAVKNAISNAFRAMGIAPEGYSRFTEGMQFPDLSDVGEILLRENLPAYNRLDPLFTLGLFTEQSRAKSFETLTSESIAIDLSRIPSDEIKNALSQLVVLSAHHFYNAQQQPGGLRQALIFDEAHRVLNSEFMPSFVRECRAYGVSTILSSQYPDDFVAEISASMATKILHSNGRDVNRVKTIVQMLGCEGREEEAANLDRFQAFLDNRHYPHTLLRTMSYPVFLLATFIEQRTRVTREELKQIKGLDFSKLSLDYLIRQLENLGYVEEKEDYIHLSKQVSQ
jgi:DNA phosphorothioation-dependent restriction protein DptH